MLLAPCFAELWASEEEGAVPAPACWALVPQQRSPVLGMSPAKHDTPLPAGVFSFHPNPFIQRDGEKRGLCLLSLQLVLPAV